MIWYDVSLHWLVACNHPSLVTKDLKTDKDAIEPKAASSKGGDSDDEADDLADMFGGLGVSSGKKCEVCQYVSVTPFHHRSAYLNDNKIGCQLVKRARSARSVTTLPASLGVSRWRVLARTSLLTQRRSGKY